MCILDVVHNIRPPLKGNNEKNGRPGHADVIKGDGILKGILLPWPAVRVVLVPVDAARIIWFVRVRVRPGRFVAVEVIETTTRQVIAPVHAIVLVQTADVVLVAVLILVVGGDRAD